MKNIVDTITGKTIFEKSNNTVAQKAQKILDKFLEENKDYIADIKSGEYIIYNSMIFDLANLRAFFNDIDDPKSKINKYLKKEYNGGYIIPTKILFAHSAIPHTFLVVEYTAYNLAGSKLYSSRETFRNIFFGKRRGIGISISSEDADHIYVDFLKKSL